MTKQQTAISPTRSEDYPEWYQQVIKAADLAENSPVRGCMVIKPWGWGIWENLQKELDDRFKATGHENAYFPLFIPLSYLEKEAEHVDGFAKECAVVTHHRLEEKDGKLVPTGELDEPLIVRPTSETIIGEAFSRWIKSYRDLPLLINQWANVVRWEMRPRLFLRTAEFLWQEGHTAHANEDEARKEVMRMAEVYREVMEDIIAMPVILGEKSESERFPGAVTTVCLEAMMQDRKALQAGTSHYLGTNFSKASGIEFLDVDNELKLAHTTSWGVSTRLIGGMIMSHGDDDGLRVPPKLAPKHVVILPFLKKDSETEVLEYAEMIADELQKLTFNNSPIRVQIDKRDIRGGEKSWSWVKKGIPIRIEVGPRDLKEGKVVLNRRDQGVKEKIFLTVDELKEGAVSILEEIQNSYFAQAKANLDANMETGVSNVDEFRAYFTAKNPDKPEIHGGFVRAPWSGDEKEIEALLSELKVSIRCIPFKQSGTLGKCIFSGKPATCEAIFAKAY